MRTVETMTRRSSYVKYVERVLVVWKDLLAGVCLRENGGNRKEPKIKQQYDVSTRKQ